eukprot:gnl/MRDRNA2_/MRDRNA2_60946_c0_seq2.p1 gnl/MRDRNA2_/MRDRNA2_60946_c0~~gnl/MRDRNA2_/MRDRNA2_60946_c0_seq2.p1  ORF type:complete len:174 (+),score=40.44 gnl/MRDRNA2_/MRDRNA2_60946_c0_seq2:88-609(+)
MERITVLARHVARRFPNQPQVPPRVLKQCYERPSLQACRHFASYDKNAQLVPETTSAAEITRMHTDDKRMSQIVIHNNTVYLSGQVPASFDAPLAEQVKSTLAKVDKLLADAGTDKTKLLSAQIWLKDMKDFGEMNAIWCEWLNQAHKPVRACVQAPMALPGILFEVMVVAAK